MDIFNNLPTVKNFGTRKEWEEGIWKIIIQKLTDIESNSEFESAINLLAGPYERRAIVYRALTASRIKSGASYREIGRELWVSSSTISAMKKSLSEKIYRSSNRRGHKKNEYTITRDKIDRPEKIYTIGTKYGPMKDWKVMQ